MRMAARVNRRESGLSPPFQRFYDDYLSVEGAPAQSPYLNLFTNGKPTSKNFWFNRNVAGSYAPSSLRPDKPFLQVISVDGTGQGAQYSLRKNHTQLALQHLLNGAQLLPTALAAALMREYYFEAPRGMLAAEAMKAFREDFGFNTERAQADGDFEILFDSKLFDESNIEIIDDSGAEEDGEQEA